jgi:hypothetical protein
VEKTRKLVLDMIDWNCEIKTLFMGEKIKRRAIFQQDRHSGKIVLQESMAFTKFCG